MIEEYGTVTITEGRVHISGFVFKSGVSVRSAALEVIAWANKRLLEDMEINESWLGKNYDRA